MHQSPRLSVRAVIYRDDEILLTKHKDERGFWYITPGGGVCHGEDLHQALHREALEELGATIHVGELLCIREIKASELNKDYLPADFHQVELFFACQLTSLGDNEAQGMDRRQIGYEWVKLRELEHVLFFPAQLVQNFIEKDFSDIYYGVLS